MILFIVPKWKELISSWRAILHISIPAAGSNIILPVTLGIITRLVADFGTSANAAFGVATRLEAFATIPMMALSTAFGPFMGQNWGAQKIDRVRRAFRFGVVFSIVWGISVALLFWIDPVFFTKYFNDSQKVSSIAAAYLLIVPVSYALLGICLVAVSCFNGIGKPLPAVVLSLLRSFIFYIPAAYIGMKLGGLYGIFHATLVSNIVVGVVAFIIVSLFLKSNLNVGGNS